ncbi:MAG: 16S rRNA (guanine(966)-N(2))-methyltransferase RsmD [Clostridia bacterium]|nr:16S rRNA (guanine(966)-N(2))-methyltransferase RsmD [Clostridia bacterium]
MRVVAGTARGIKLDTIEGLATRPTTDRVKEAIFSMIHNELYGAKVLDLFSGSGGLSIEAASRGAEKVTLVENSKKCIEIIKKNIQKSRLNDKIEVVQQDVDRFLERLPVDAGFDFVVMDPPYLKGFIEPILLCIDEKKIIKVGGMVIVEHDMTDVLAETYGTLQLEKKKKYGKTAVSVYRRHQND